MAYRWRAYAVGVQARASWPLGSRLTPFVQAGAGATLAFDAVLAPVDNSRSESLGWHLRGGAGLLVRLGRSVALFSEAAYVAAPVHFGRNVAAAVTDSTGDFDGIYEEHVDFVWRNLRRLGVSAAQLDERLPGRVSGRAPAAR